MKPLEESVNPMGMQIVVRDTKNFTALQLAYATGYAVMRYLFHTEHSSVEKQAINTWLSENYRKVLRRAKKNEWEKVVSLENSHYHSFNGVEVCVVEPTPVAETAPLLRKLQVSGLQVSEPYEQPVPYSNPNFTVYINENLNMSAPKAAAAVAHVLQIQYLSATPSQLEQWNLNNLAFNVQYSNHAREAVAENNPNLVHVSDSGFTEVEPGSITAYGVWGV